MALDEDDIKAITKLINDSFNGTLGKKAAERAGEAQAAAISKAIEEAVGAKLAEATKAQADVAAKPNPEAEERKTLTMRVKELEAERDKAKAEAKAERVNTAFRKAWAGAKFVPDLADEHMAALEKHGRILEDEGVMRVRDPKKHASETQPTLEEYVAELAKSDRGKLYQPARTTPGQGANGATQTPFAKRDVPPGAMDAVFGGNFGESQ